jgi:hypothetical protein
MPISPAELIDALRTRLWDCAETVLWASRRGRTGPLAYGKKRGPCHLRKELGSSLREPQN